MNQTEDIKELVSALSKAQGKMKPATFNKINPHFKNRYADFTSCMDAARSPLSENGLSILQYCEHYNEKLTLVTMLAHTSGQWIKSYFPLNPTKMDSQSIGSAMTYAKRYSLSAMLGIVSDEEDDDGEAAQGRGKGSDAKTFSDTVNAPPKINTEQLNIIKKIEEKLDAKRKKRVADWMKTVFKTEKIEDLLAANFPKVIIAFENAIKDLEQEKKEGMNANN